MTTKTKPAKNAATREGELREAVSEARKDLADTRQRAHEYRERIHGFRSKLLARATSDPREFDPTNGNPRPNSEALKLADQIRKLVKEDNLDTATFGAEERLKTAEAALKAYRETQCRELLTEMLPEAQEKRDAFMEWVAEGRAKFSELVEVGTRAAGLVTPGRKYDTRTIPTYEHHQRLLRDLAQEPPLPLPSQFLAELQAEEGEDD